ncbi:MAG: BrnT family toxin [Elusimicrobia bacterium]|nr:BrnT family toxin [Elusimicrobiota bacterium]
MRFLDYEWDEVNTSHIARHHVKPFEVEETCFNNPFVLKGPEEKYFVFGKTDAGRCLFVVIVPKEGGKIRPITAREMNQVEKKRYKKHRR